MGVATTVTGQEAAGSLVTMTLARARLHVLLAVLTVLAVGFLTGCGGSLDPGTEGGGSPGGPGSTPPGYGVPQQGYPTWQERALLVLTNAVRMAPLDYRAKYAADFAPSLAAAHVLEAYPAVAPLRWNLALNESARAHSADMGAHGCFQHDSCDGTAWNVRIESYYTLSGTIGENIAAGYPAPVDPRYAMSMWLCDESGSACCADGASCDGHRRNMMNGAYEALGPGYAGVAAYYENYWTQDFGGAFDGSAPPLVDGSHIPFPSGKITFLANYHDTAPPRLVTVVLDGTSTPLSLDLGAAASGSWAGTVPTPSGCHAYHFEAVDGAGNGWRYPASGDLRTYGAGGCTEDWAP